MTATLCDAPATHRRLLGPGVVVLAWKAQTILFRARLGRLRAARTIEAQFATLQGEVLADLAMPAEEILGVRRQCDDLPFFMHHGFDRRD